jgi:hypothetical protein
LFVEHCSHACWEQHLSITITEVSDNSTVWGEQVNTVFFFSVTREKLVLSHLNDVSITQMLHNESIGKSSCHLVVSDLV